MKKVFCISCIAYSFCFAFGLITTPADILLPGPGPECLDFWTFDDTNNWTTIRGYPPASSTNVDTAYLGDYWTAILANTNSGLGLRDIETERVLQSVN